MAEVLRYAAFTTTPEGGNPAGVVLDAAGLDDAAMLAIAAEVGYSETAFLTGPPPAGRPVPGRRATSARSPRSPSAVTPRSPPASPGRSATARAPRPAHPFGVVALDVRTRAAARSRRSRASPPQLEPCRGRRPRRGARRAELAARDLDPALPPRVALAGARIPCSRPAPVTASPSSTTTSPAWARSWPRATGQPCSSLARTRRRSPRARPVPARRRRRGPRDGRAAAAALGGLPARARARSAARPPWHAPGRRSRPAQSAARSRACRPGGIDVSGTPCRWPARATPSVIGPDCMITGKGSAEGDRHVGVSERVQQTLEHRAGVRLGAGGQLPALPRGFVEPAGERS